MSNEPNKLLKRLDTLNKNLEILGKIIAVNVGKEVLFKEKKQKEQITFLSELGLPRNIIASMLGTTLGTVSVTKSKQKPKKKTDTDNKKTGKEDAEKTAEN